MQPRKYKHVILFGIDGAGAFVKDTDTPNLDRIFNSGAYTYKALASMPTISGQCWGSIFLGTSPAVHKLTNNVVSSYEFHPTDVLQTVFYRVRKQYPQATLSSFCCWNPINYGIIEHNIGVNFDTCEDFELAEHCVKHVLDEKPDLFFIHFDSVDAAGHKSGYGSDGHLKQITAVDALVGKVYDAYVQAGIAKDTLFLAVADHGGTPGNKKENRGGGHGGFTKNEKYVFFMVAGENVQRTELDDVKIRDLAAIMLYAFGIEPPKRSLRGWTAKIPDKLFISSSGM